VTVTVDSKQQTWTKKSLPQIVYMECQLNNDQALYVNVMTPLTRSGEFLCAETPLLDGGEQPEKPENAFSRSTTNEAFSKICG